MIKAAEIGNLEPAKTDFKRILHQVCSLAEEFAKALPDAERQGKELKDMDFWHALQKLSDLLREGDPEAKGLFAVYEGDFEKELGCEASSRLNGCISDYNFEEAAAYLENIMHTDFRLQAGQTGEE